MGDILNLDGVGKAYGDLKALDQVSLAVPAGEWLSITGPSGSGKTTLMNIVGCLDRPTSGRVKLAGQELESLSGSALAAIRRNTVGLIFQTFHLIGHLTALENVMVAQYYHSLPDEAEARLALERVGLAGRADHRPAQLSGGEQQRVCIARALINDPKVVLADEPTGNLDAANEAKVMDIFRQLQADRTTLIVVTHDPAVAALGDREVALDHGRVVRQTRHRGGRAGDRRAGDLPDERPADRLAGDVPDTRSKAPAGRGTAAGTSGAGR
ncbi:MAG: ABC transporter ATP-binding protein [Propionibacteriaceae bacterium]|jgi:putative ABC transport system ATP-binding protein|nr:ABC transporter ATP-binding protein [Propionibacteriaceae bacterium]